jgi:hypothetical protein
VELTARAPEIGVEVGPMSSVAQFLDLPSVGYCETKGILLQLDAHPGPTDLQGTTLELTARISDPNGDAAEETMTFTLSSTIKPWE